MPSRARLPKSRRTFLKSIPVALVAGGAVPAGEAEAQESDAAQPETASITAATLGAAQQVIGINLPEAEREMARPLVIRNRDNYDLLRAVVVPSGTEPAFSFRPPQPRRARASLARPPAVMPPAARMKRPASVDELAFAPVTTLAALLRTRQISSIELTAMYLERLQRFDPTLHCVVTLTEDLARAQAAAADREIRAGRYRGPLHGIPYGIKDLFAAKGAPTTWGAKPYASQVFDYDSTAVVRLRDAGAVLLGKLSTGELAIGDLWFGARTRNPWNPERGASGSSAGPASATAAGLVGFAVGTETGGSIVSPASTCGVVGLRPTYGRISRHGCMTLRWTLDKVGPIARSVADAGLILAALHGPDGHDETVADLPFEWSGQRSVTGLRIGYVEQELLAAGGEDREHSATRRELYEAALDVYRRGGATLVPIVLPGLPAAAIYAALNAEAGAMFDELLRSGAINELADKGPNGRANQLRATRFIPAVEYIRAQRVRTLLQQEMNTLLATIDAFLAPSTSESVTITNLTGHPAAVVPAGFVDGLPVALMVTGKLWDEAMVLRVAAAFEHGTDWHTKHPTI
jgi:Asp-tRNA(Asn)/Glu-tRNA(Gln) amidotransferase A subunit family amidase